MAEQKVRLGTTSFESVRRDKPHCYFEYCTRCTKHILQWGPTSSERSIERLLK